MPPWNFAEGYFPLVLPVRPQEVQCASATAAGQQLGVKNIRGRRGVKTIF